MQGLNVVKRITLQGIDQLSRPVEQMQRAVTALERSVDSLAKKTLPGANSGLQAFLRLLEKIAKTTIDLPVNLEKTFKRLEAFNKTFSFIFDELNDTGNAKLSDMLASLQVPVGDALKGMGAPINALRAQMASIPPGVASAIAQSANLIDNALVDITRRAKKVVEIPAGQAFGAVGKVTGALSGLSEPVRIVEQLRNATAGVVGKVFELTQEIGLFSLGIQSLQQMVQSGPFRLLIQQNIDLRAQLLSTQASLVGTSRILQRGFEIQDPTQAIQALTVPVKNAIADLREASFDLVGVTSKELIPVFQVASQQITSWGGGLKEAKDLTVAFAATFGTLGVPMIQARQEIMSIMQGTIDMNSVVAQSLGLTNQMVARWKEQGIAIDELKKRLSAFVAGNKLAAMEVMGVWSNIIEVFDEIGRVAGEQLLAPISSGLDSVYKNLRKNAAELADYVGNLVKVFMEGLTPLIQSLGELGAALSPLAKKIPVYLVTVFAQVMQELAKAIHGTSVVLTPLLEIMGRLADLVGLLSPLITVFLQVKVAELAIKGLGGAFSTLANLIPGLGDALFFLNIRTTGFLGQFTQLTKIAGPGIAGFLLAAQHSSLFQGQLAKLSTTIPIIGPLLVKNAGILGQFGATLVGMYGKFPVARELMARFSVESAGLLRNLAALAQRNGLPQVATLLTDLSTKTNVATVANEAFSNSMVKMGKAIALVVLKAALIIGGLYLVATAFNELILKNQALMTTLGGLAGGIQTLGQLIIDLVKHPIGMLLLAITAVAVAIQFKLIPQLKALAFWIGANITGSVLKLIPLLFEMAAGFQAVGMTGAAGLFSQMAVGLNSMVAAFAAGGGGLPAFIVGLKGVAIAAGSVILAITGVVAAIASFLLWYRKLYLADQQGAFDEISEQARELAKEAMDDATKLKAANDRANAAKEKGIALSEAEIKANQKLASSAKLRLADLKAQIDLVKGLEREAPGELKDAYQSIIGDLEGVMRALEKQSSAVVITQKALPALGDAYEQLSAKVRGAMDAIDNPFGEPEIFKKRAAELLQYTQEQQKLGQISLADARDRYKKLSALTTLEIDVQIQAFEALQAAEREYFEQSIGLLQDKEKQVQAMAASGDMDSVRAAMEAGRLRVEIIEEQIDKERTLYRNQAEFGELTKEQDQAFKSRINTLRTEAQKLRAEAQEAVNAAQLRQYQLAQAQLLDQAKASEQVRLRAVKELALANKTDYDLQRQRIQDTRDGLNEQLQIQAQYLRSLEQQSKLQNPEKEEERLRALRAERTKYNDLVLSLYDNEIEAQRLVTQFVVRAIDEQAKAREAAIAATTEHLERQNRLLEIQSQLFESQNRLIDTRKALLSAMVTSADSDYSFLIQQEKSAEKQKKLAAELAKIKYQAALTELDIERQKLAIQERQLAIAQQRERMALNQEELQAKAALATAQAEYARAQANKESTEQERFNLALAVQHRQELLAEFDLRKQLLAQQQALQNQELEGQKRVNEIESQTKFNQATREFAGAIGDDKRGKQILDRQVKEAKQRITDDRRGLQGDYYQRGIFKVPTPAIAPINLPMELKNSLAPTQRIIEASIVPLLEEISKRTRGTIDVGGIVQNIEAGSGGSVAAPVRDAVYDAFSEILR